MKSGLRGRGNVDQHMDKLLPMQARERRVRMVGTLIHAASDRLPGEGLAEVGRRNGIENQS